MKPDTTPQRREVRVVIVKWRDANSITGYVDEKETIGSIVFTIGGVLREDEDGIVLASETNGGGLWRHGFTIPHGNILKVEDLYVHTPEEVEAAE